MIFSFSRLSLYQTCPFRFKKKYIDFYVEPETLPLSFGKGVHKAAQERLLGANFDDAIMTGFIEANMNEKINKLEMSKLVSRIPLKRLEGRVDEVEMYFELPLSKEFNAPVIRGYIDLLTNDKCIYDWKTNRISYEAIQTFQMGIYAWAVKELKGYYDVIVTLSFLRLKKESSFLFGLKEMEMARRWAYNLAKEIEGKALDVQMFPENETSIFPAKPSSRCATCPFVIECFQKTSSLSKIS